MARYDREKKDLTAKQILDKFGVRYYEELIDELRTRISNIRSGNGDRSSKYEYRRDREFKNQAEKERKIEQLNKQIKVYQETIKEIREAISSINRSSRILRKAAEKKVLISSLHDTLRDCFIKYEKNDLDKREMIPSSTYDEIFKSGLFHTRSKYMKLFSKEYKIINKETVKMKKEIYKKVKKISNRYIVEDRIDYGYGSSRNRIDYSTLHGALTENNHSLEGFAGALFINFANEYKSWEVDTLTPLGVEADKVKRAVEISDGEKRMFDDYGPLLKSMEYLAREYNVAKRFKTFYYLKNDLTNIEKLSREVECLDLIIDAYDNTAIKDTDLFKELIEIYRTQQKELSKMAMKFRETFERTGLKEYIELEKKLRELHRNCGTLSWQIHNAEKQYGYNDEELTKLNDLYVGARAEMLSILLKYPELNKKEYGIDLSKYDRKGRYRGKDEEALVSQRKKDLPIEEDVVIPTRVVTEDELKVDLGIDDRKPEYDTDKVVLEEEKDSLELPDDLRTYRTVYYSRYMVEKVKGSVFGKMTFSEYLENVAPELKELIKFEQLREKKAKTVFKSYIQYLAALENKQTAMAFSDFARLRHGLDPDELPFEYSDEEVNKRLSI